MTVCEATTVRATTFSPFLLHLLKFLDFHTNCTSRILVLPSSAEKLFVALQASLTISITLRIFCHCFGSCDHHYKMAPHPVGWIFCFSVLPSLALRRLLNFTQQTLDAVSGGRQVDGQGSSGGEVTDFASENLETERSGGLTDRNHDASRDLVSTTVNEGDAVDSTPEILSSRNSIPTQDVTGARLVNEPETLGLQTRSFDDSQIFPAYCHLIKCANRPRNPRRPWLPRFPKIRTRPHARACSNIPPQELNKRPRSKSFPKQRFLIDTTYPIPRRPDPEQVEIENALFLSRLVRLPIVSLPTPAATRRPAPNNVPLFAEINAICTKKRRAQDSEIDLVAASYCARDENLPSRVTLFRSPITPDSELEYQAKSQVCKMLLFVPHFRVDLRLCSSKTCWTCSLCPGPSPG